MPNTGKGEYQRSACAGAALPSRGTTRQSAASNRRNPFILSDGRARAPSTPYKGQITRARVTQRTRGSLLYIVLVRLLFEPGENLARHVFEDVLLILIGQRGDAFDHRLEIVKHL